MNVFRHVSHFISKFNRPTSQEAVAKFTNLYVKNFDESVDEAALRELFGKYGEITSVKIAKTPDDKSACFGFVNFTKPEDAALVIIRSIFHLTKYNFKPILQKFPKTPPLTM